MKKNNKGYSFVELIITMAIFSIVMLAIIMMMRTSLVSYRNGLFETEMQEEAQIVLNQVSEFLVDAQSVSPVSEGYSITDDSGTSILAFNSANNELTYAGVVLSDQVESFSISGLDNVFTNYDNTARISITISHNGRDYSADKDVYFRNSTVESPDLYDLNGKETIVIGGGDENTKNIKIFRYGNLDLTKEYDVIKLTGSNDNAKSNYIYKVGGTEYSLSDLSHSDVSSKKPSDGKGIILEPNMTKRVDKNGISESLDCQVFGLTRSGKTLTFKISTDDISFNKNGVDVFQNHWDYNLSGTGYVTYIPVEGINIYGATKSNEVEVKYTINLKKTSKSADFTTGEKTINTAFADKGSNGGEEVGTDQGGLKVKARVKLLSDEYSEGMMITTPSDQGNNEASDLYNGAEDGDQLLTFHIMVKKKNTGAIVYEQDVIYKYTYVGKALNKLN